MNTLLRIFPLVRKQMTRQPLRTTLTLSGVAVAMFLFCTVSAMRAGVERATTVTAADSVLVVYRENRYCPFTSRLPQYYSDRIEAIPGVVSAVPMKIEVSNCRTSLDVVTFRGVPEDAFVEHFVPGFTLLDGSIENWKHRTDSALVGSSLAARRRVQVGDRLDSGGVVVTVSGIIDSDEPQDQNAAYTHLSFLQEIAGRGGTGGEVTQFQVKVADPGRIEEVAQAIDEEFKRDPDPTTTRPEKAFVAAAAEDILEIVGFASWLGWGALAAVFALVANAIVLAVRDRVTEHAILETVGFAPSHIALLVLIEGTTLGLLGGIVGAIAAFSFTQQRFSIGMEGLNIEIASDPTVIATGLILSVSLGLVAGLFPAWRASRRELTTSFRAI